MSTNRYRLVGASFGENGDAVYYNYASDRLPSVEDWMGATEVRNSMKRVAEERNLKSHFLAFIDFEKREITNATQILS